MNSELKLMDLMNELMGTIREKPSPQGAGAAAPPKQEGRLP